MAPATNPCPTSANGFWSFFLRFIVFAFGPVFQQHHQAGSWQEALQRRFAATPRFKTSNARDALEFLNRS
jgi:hypothetical protein